MSPELPMLEESRQPAHSPTNRARGQCTALQFFFNSSSTDKALKIDRLPASDARYLLTRFVPPVNLADGGELCPVWFQHRILSHLALSKQTCVPGNCASRE